MNVVNNQGLIASLGSEGILGLAGSSNRINVFGADARLGTDANDSPIYRVTGSTATEFLISGGA